MEFFLDESARTLSEFIKRPLSNDFYLSQAQYILNRLNAFQDSQNTGSKRICLHEYGTSDINVMLICENNILTKLPRKHLTKGKLFIVIKGKIRIDVFNDNNQIISSEELKAGSENIFIYINRNTFHRSYSISDEATYLEVIQGPFLPETDETQYIIH